MFKGLLPGYMAIKKGFKVLLPGYMAINKGLKVYYLDTWQRIKV